MRAILLNCPDANLTPESVGKLTFREAWEWYIRPQMDRTEHQKRAMRDGGEPTKVIDPKSEAEALFILSAMGVKGVPSVATNGRPDEGPT